MTPFVFWLRLGSEGCLRWLRVLRAAKTLAGEGLRS